jgi:hypothetical protein
MVKMINGREGMEDEWEAVLTKTKQVNKKKIMKMK